MLLLLIRNKYLSGGGVGGTSDGYSKQIIFVEKKINMNTVWLN